jgi:hypothetical protein
MFGRKPKAFGLPPELTAVLDDLYTDMMDMTEVENAIDARRHSELSDWDVALLARRGRHVNRVGDQLWDCGDILAPIRRLALNHRLQQFARRLVAELSPDDLERLDERIARWGESRGFAPDGGFEPLARLVANLPRFEPRGADA